MTTISTDEAGSTKIITQVVTSIPSSTPSTDSDAASNTYTSSNNEDSSSLSTPAIIGISVGAGVLVLSLIACAVWRMKRRHGDEDEAIRWPELNRHGDADTHHALPARVTGQHGIETNPLVSLSFKSSRAGRLIPFTATLLVQFFVHLRSILHRSPSLCPAHGSQRLWLRCRIVFGRL
ncbi:hypothetical protein BD324DRAFT_357896 [Kockovaella imperatae]|uniref:Mid2 domain-containing protein n=1 Tax=Kockovaella imperatae TaxID=4999 RepID=A0A1Y1ULQ5_9TREE|nr:hypothetical protein BD324DRAFT_357896 [Kockovaella imperatae]ORX38444.1 hypothetical protein BD324DRAFT_357896 [Kockovaella imperatae]